MPTGRRRGILDAPGSIRSAARRTAAIACVLGCLTACDGGRPAGTPPGPGAPPSVGGAPPSPAGAPSSATARAAESPPGQASPSSGPGSAPPAGALPATAEVDPSRRAAVEKALETVKELRKARRHAEALRELDSGLEAARGAPDLTAKVLLARGEVQFREAQRLADGESFAESQTWFRDALTTFQDLLARFPGEGSASPGAYLVGSCHLMLDDFRAARDAYRLVCDRYPTGGDRCRALVRVGVCEAGLGNVPAAVTALRRATAECRGPEDASDLSKARKYLTELELVGKRAPPVRASEWVHGVAAPGGLETFRGEVVVLVFFATWCENCGDELPHLRHLIARWGDQGAVFVGIANPDDPKNTLPVDVYVEKNEIPFRDVALDPGGASWGPYRVSALPAAVVIDRKGVIRWRGHPAFLPGAMVRTCLDEA